SGGSLNLTGMDFAGCASAAVTNQPPVVYAGPGQAIALPANAVLAGSVSDDGLPAGSTVTVQWSLVSGPTNVVFSTPTNTNTSVLFSLDGIYVLRLTASDSQLSASNEVTVTVDRENHPPIAFSQTVTNLEDTTTN